jgi:hypothetical protein
MNGINFNALEGYRANYQWRRNWIAPLDAQFPLPPATGEGSRNDYRCKKYEYHRTYDNSVICPACGSDLYGND